MSAVIIITWSFLHADENQKEESMEEEEEEDPLAPFYPQVLAGFIMVLTEEGDMIYLTENVSRYIGITQVQLNKKNIFQ